MPEPAARDSPQAALAREQAPETAKAQDDPRVRLLDADPATAIRQALSPRFVPDEILQVAEIPRTLTGKKQELPIKKLLLGQPLAKVVNKDAMANPGCLDWYEDFARQHLARTGTTG